MNRIDSRARPGRLVPALLLVGAASVAGCGGGVWTAPPASRLPVAPLAAERADDTGAVDPICAPGKGARRGGAAKPGDDGDGFGD